MVLRFFMLLVDPVTALIVATLAAGNVDAACKAYNTKEADVYYAYDPAYFCLGDENHCNAPKKRGCGANSAPDCAPAA